MCPPSATTQSSAYHRNFNSMKGCFSFNSLRNYHNNSPVGFSHLWLLDWGWPMLFFDCLLTDKAEMRLHSVGMFRMVKKSIIQMVQRSFLWTKAANRSKGKNILGIDKQSLILQCQEFLHLFLINLCELADVHRFFNVACVYMMLLCRWVLSYSPEFEQLLNVIRISNPLFSTAIRPQLRYKGEPKIIDHINTRNRSPWPLWWSSFEKLFFSCLRRQSHEISSSCIISVF